MSASARVYASSASAGRPSCSITIARFISRSPRSISRQLVTDRVGDGERFVGPSARRNDRHEGARQLGDTGAVVEFLADRDGRTEMVLGVREAVELTLGKGLRPERDQPGKSGDVVASRGSVARRRAIRTANRDATGAQRTQPRRAASSRTSGTRDNIAGITSGLKCSSPVVHSEGVLMRRSAPRPRQPFLDDKGRTAPAGGADTERPDRVPTRAGDHRPAPLRRWERFTGADRRAGRQGRRRRVAHRRDRRAAAEPLPIPPRVLRPERRRDRPAPTGRSPRSGRERSCPNTVFRIGSFTADPMRFIRLRRRPDALLVGLRRRSDALLELEHGPAVHPPVVARRSSAAEQWAGQGDDRDPRHRDSGRRGPSCSSDVEFVGIGNRRSVIGRTSTSTPTSTSPPATRRSSARSSSGRLRQST